MEVSVGAAAPGCMTPWGVEKASSSTAGVDDEGIDGEGVAENATADDEGSSACEEAMGAASDGGVAGLDPLENGHKLKFDRP